MLFQTLSYSHHPVLLFVKRIFRLSHITFICLTASALQISLPSPSLCNVLSTTQESIPPFSVSEIASHTSLMHMRDFFKNVSQYFGTRYRSGGQTPAGFDCSGFVRFMYEKVFNMTLPRSSREMSALGSKVSKEELQPGDLVFFHSKSKRINHVGIFIGNDTFIHSSLTKGITEDQLKYNYYEKRFAGAVRLLDISGSLHTTPPPQQDAAMEIVKPS
ncbi:MAG: C40 family peptidase [Chlorobium sp.]